MGDGASASDGGQVALVEVAEGPQRLAGYRPPDVGSGVIALFTIWWASNDLKKKRARLAAQSD